MRIVILGVALAFLQWSAAHAATPAAKVSEAYAVNVCLLLETHAALNNLPVNFLTRLIWKESTFNDQAVSPVGAEGIAQFMPGTARLRGLANSFDYREALPAAASYLAFLRQKFGNLGLAAAAYNSGEDGTARWLAKRRNLPDETEDYVLAITGQEAEKWRNASASFDIPGIGGKEPRFADNCVKLVRREWSPPRPGTSPRTPQSPVRKPWGVVVAGSFSEGRTLALFRSVKTQHATLLKYELPMIVRTRNLSRGRKRMVRVMIGRNSRKEALDLCSRLRARSGVCIVSKT